MAPPSRGASASGEIRSIIAKRAPGVAGRVSGHSLRGGSAQLLAAAGAGLVELHEARDWQAPNQCRRTAHQHAAPAPS